MVVGNLSGFLGFDLGVLDKLPSIVYFFAFFNCHYNLAKKFNKSNGTAVCAGLFSFIFVLMFGFSNGEVYHANISVSKNGIFGAVNGNNMNNTGNQSYEERTSGGVIDQGFSFCSNCGSKIDKNDRFCSNCGTEKV